MRFRRDVDQIRCLRLLGIVLSAVVGSLASTATADEYFQKALDRIEESLVQPAEDYGLTVTDVFTNQTTKALAALGPIKEKWGLYTLQGKVHYRIERFDPRESDSAPYFVHVSVTSGVLGENRSAVNVRGKTTLSTNLEPRTCGIGQIDAYNRHAKEEDKLDHPDEQPYQIMANPCFAPLKLTPVELRKLSVVALPDEDGAKVYEVAKQDNDDQVVFRFYFSPTHGDALERTDVGIMRGDRQGFLTHTVRRIETWQSLADGSEVPERFTLQREENGKTMMTLTRVISRPAIGNVDPDLFDTEKLPEFQVEFHQVQDPALRLKTKGMEGVSYPKLDEKKPSRNWIVLVNLVAFGALGIYWWRQRGRTA